jgi:hypothetical protein
MKGEHVIGLIDAGALAGHAAAHPDAWQHLQECATCAAALSAAARVRHGLKSLPQPDPPRDLSGSVLARIAQMDDALSGRRNAAAASGYRTSMWLTAVGAAVAALAISVFVVSSGSGEPGAAMSGSAIRSGLMQSPAGAATALAGIVLYAAGLFAAIDRARRST